MLLFNCEVNIAPQCSCLSLTCAANRVAFFKTYRRILIYIQVTPLPWLCHTPKILRGVNLCILVYENLLVSDCSNAAVSNVAEF